MSTETITVMSGPLEGQRFTLDGPLSIGRNPGNTIMLDDRLVSRQHAIVEHSANGTLLKDLGSGNGTFVGDRRVLEYRLSDGDVFKIGSVDLKYEGTAPPTSATVKEDTKLKFGDRPSNTITASSDNVFQTLFTAPEAAGGSAQLAEAQQRLEALYRANQIISSERDLEKLFSRVLDELFNLVPANNGVILIVDEDTNELAPMCTRTGEGESQVQISSSIVEQAHTKGEAVLVFDAADDDRFEASASIVTGNIASAMCVPLSLQDEKLGVIYVDTRGTTNAFAEGDLELMVALSGPAAIAIKNAQYMRELEDEFQTTLKLLANAIELRDHYTVGHTWRVTKFSLALAEEMGWTPEKLREVEMGGVLHDVGKIGVDDSVLRKPGKLTDEEYAKMKIHPERGAALMRDSKRLAPLIPYCLYHHERFDGRGYPKGLTGEEIPIEGRVVAVADTFDAMTSNRPYRKGLNPEIAIEELEKNKGTQFDPDCVDAFIRAYRAGKINYILQDYHQNEKSIVCPFCSTYVPIPEGSELDTIFQCGVCHRHMRLEKMNEAYCGQLLTEEDLK